MPSVERGVGCFFAFAGAPSDVLGRPGFFFSVTAGSSFFCFLAAGLALSVLPADRTVLPSAFSFKPSFFFSDSSSFLSPFSSASSRFLLSPEPLAFSSTFSSEAFLTTSFPDRSILTAGLSGSAFFLTLFPFLEVMETSPSVFFSATVPPGAPPPQFHETIREACQRGDPQRLLGMRSGIFEHLNAEDEARDVSPYALKRSKEAPSYLETHAPSVRARRKRTFVSFLGFVRRHGDVSEDWLIN